MLNQVTDEVKAFTEMLKSVYADLGFDDVKVKFSTRPDVCVLDLMNIGTRPKPR